MNIKHVIAATVSGLVAVAFLLIPSCIEDSSADDELMALPRGTQQYDLRVQGQQHPLKVTEFVDRSGHHCVLVTGVVNGTSVALSCEH